jgi:hypothetical protein
MLGLPPTKIPATQSGDFNGASYKVKKAVPCLKQRTALTAFLMEEFLMANVQNQELR